MWLFCKICFKCLKQNICPIGLCLINGFHAAFLKVCFKFAESKYWTYWTVLNKCFITGPYLMDLVSSHFFWKFHFKYLEAYYLNYWNVLSKNFIPGSYLMKPISYDLCQKSILKLTLKKYFVSWLAKKLLYLLQWESFKNEGESFLVHLKRFFRSQDI